MTLLQAIKMAKRITFFVGGISLDITKKQARELRAQSDWSGEWDGEADVDSWEIDGDMWLTMSIHS